MESKIHSTIVITSILAFALIAAVIPTAFVSVSAQGEGGGTGGMPGGEGMTGSGGPSADTGGMTEDGGMAEDGGMTEDIGGPTSGEP